MNNEMLMREWFGAVRAAADKAVGTLADPPAPNTPGRVKTDILLRRYLRDGLELYVVQSEGVGRGEAAEICDAVCSELMEDAMAGIWSPGESMDFARFLLLCTDGASRPGTFAELLRRALNADVAATDAEGLRNTADRELAAFAAQRKASRAAK